MQCQHVLDDELRGVTMIAVLMLLDVKADDVKAFSEQAFSPAAKAAKEVDS